MRASQTRLVARTVARLPAPILSSESVTIWLAHNTQSGELQQHNDGTWYAGSDVLQALHVTIMTVGRIVDSAESTAFIHRPEANQAYLFGSLYSNQDHVFPHTNGATNVRQPTQ